MQYGGHYDDDDDDGEGLHGVEDLQDLPLPEALAVAADLLGHEDTRLPAAFALLERLKLPAPEDDMAQGAPKLLRLLGRFLGYHPAVLEQVLEALSLGECSGPIIEALPLLVVGAGPEEVARVVEALKQALQDDLAGLLLPVLGALFDLPLGPRLRREALGLAQEALAVVQDADVPVVVRTLLRTLDEHSDPAVLAHIRAECAGLSPQATAVLMEVLATALSTNPKVARLLLLSIRSSTGAGTTMMGGQQQQQLSIVDALVLVLLFSHPAHQPVVQDALLRFLATSPSCWSTTDGAGSSSSSSSSNSIASLLCKLVEFTAEAHWQSLATPLSEMAQWLLLSTLLPPRPRLAQALEPGQQARALAAHLLRRLFQLHAGLRDEILGFLMTLCVSCGRGTTALEGGEEEQQQTPRTGVLLPVMQASRSILAGLAQESPQLLVPYAGMLCDQLLNSASNLPTPVMGPLLRALTLLARSHVASGIEMTLIIYIQKQLWTNSISGAGATASSSSSGSSSRSSSSRRKRMRGGRVTWVVDDVGNDDGRKLASLVLAEALVSMEKTPQSKRGEGEEEEDDEEEDDLSGILTWVVRAVPMATPKVAACGLRFLLRVLTRQQQQRGEEKELHGTTSMSASLRTRERGLRQQVEEVAVGLASRLGLVVRPDTLMDKDQARLSYLPLQQQAADPAPVTLPWRASQSAAAPVRPPLLPTSKGVLGVLLQSYEGGTNTKNHSSSSASSSPLVWQVEGMVEAYVPRMVAADSVGLGPLFLVRTVVTALLDLQWKGLLTAEDKATCFEQLAVTPLLLPSWPRAMGRARQQEGEGASVWLQGSEQERGWEEDARLWREGAVTKGKGSKGKRGSSGKGKGSSSSALSKKRGGKSKQQQEEDLERLSEGEHEKDGDDEEDEEEDEEEEEDDEDDEQDVFRDRCGSKDRWLRAGWGALFGVMATGPLIEAWATARKRGEEWVEQVPASTLHALLRRHVDLLHRVRRCLERVSPTAAAAAARRAGGGAAAAAAAAIASEPVRVTRSRRQLERALGAYGSTAVGSAGMQEVLLAALLEWTGEALGKRGRENVEEEEEEDEEEEGEEGGEQRLAQLVGLVRCLLETMLCRDEQAVALEGLMPLYEEGGGEEGQDGQQVPLWVGDVKLENVGRMMAQVGGLNRLLRMVRRHRGTSTLEARDVSRLLCLYLAYTRRLCLRAAEQERVGLPISFDLGKSGRRGGGGGGGGSTTAGTGAGASSSTAAAQEQQQQQRLAGLGDVARLFKNKNEDENEGRDPSEHEAREYAFGFLAREIEQADDEGVACGLLELLACLTAGTQKAGSAACFEALHCLETAHPVVDPDLTRVLSFSGLGSGGGGGGGDGSSVGQDALPVALLHVLRPSLGLHEVQTRVLLDLRKAALSPTLPLAQRPVVRHFVLTFWSLLPRERRAAGLMRLCEGLQAVFREEAEAATEALLGGGGRGGARQGRLLQRSRHRGGVRSSSSSSSPYEAEHGIRVLRALTPDAAPALLELLLLLALTTLLLARPQPTPRTAAATTTTTRNNNHDEHDPLLLGGAYGEVQAALVALSHLMRLIGSGAAGTAAGTGRGSARVAAATVKTACLALGGLQWQVERCLAWRTARGGPRETETPAEEAQERAREHETDLGHVQRLVEDALAFVGLVADMSEAMKKQQQQQQQRGSAKKKKSSSSSSASDLTSHKSVEERWAGVAANLSDRHFVPRCVLACERLVEALRDTATLLRLPIKIQGAFSSSSTQRSRKGKAGGRKGQGGGGGGAGGEFWEGRLFRKESKSSLLLAFKVAEKKSEGNQRGGSVGRRRGEEEGEEEEEGEGWDELLDDEEGSIDLGEEEEDEGEEEDEEQFYALVSGGGGGGHGQWGSSSTQQFGDQGEGGREEEEEEEEEEEDDDCGPRRRRRSSTSFSSSSLPTPKVVVGGGANATVVGNEDGTLVVQFGSSGGKSGGKRRRRS